MTSSFEGMVCYGTEKLACIRYEGELENSINILAGENGIGKRSLLTLFNPLLYTWKSLTMYEESLLKLSFVTYQKVRSPLPRAGFINYDNNVLLWFSDKEIGKALSETVGSEHLFEMAEECQGTLELETSLEMTSLKSALEGMGTACSSVEGNKIQMRSDLSLTEGYSVYYSPGMALDVLSFEEVMLNAIKRSVNDELIERLKGIIKDMVDIRYVYGEGLEVELSDGTVIPSEAIGEGLRAALLLTSLTWAYEGKDVWAFMSNPHSLIWEFENLIEYMKLIEKGIIVISEKEKMRTYEELGGVELGVEQKKIAHGSLGKYEARIRELNIYVK